MKNQHSTVFDIVTTFITRMVVLGGSFIASVILTRLLGPEGKGIITALFVIPTTLVSLADLGVRQASAYYIGKKKYTLQEILSSNLLIWIVTSVLSILVVLIYFLIPMTEIYSPILISIAVFYIPVNILVSYFNGILQGQQLIGAMNKKTFIQLIVRLIAIVILVWVLDLGVIGAAIATVVPAFIVIFYSGKIVTKRADLKVKYYPGIPQELMKKGVSYAVALFVLSLNYKVDLIFLENMVTASELGIYSVGVTLSELIWQVPSAIAVVLFARSANSSSNAEASNRSTMLLRITWIPLMFLAIIMYVLAPLFVQIIYGQDFILAADIIRIFLPGTVAMVLFKTLNADVAGRGNPLFSLKIFSLTLIINVILSIILIPSYGMYGAAFSSTIAYITGAIFYSISYHRHTGIPYRLLFIITKDDIQMLTKIFMNFKNKEK